MDAYFPPQLPSSAKKLKSPGIAVRRCLFSGQTQNSNGEVVIDADELDEKPNLSSLDHASLQCKFLNFIIMEHSVEIYFVTKNFLFLEDRWLPIKFIYTHAHMYMEMYAGIHTYVCMCVFELKKDGRPSRFQFLLFSHPTNTSFLYCRYSWFFVCELCSKHQSCRRKGNEE